jgi:hypothetical protein
LFDEKEIYENNQVQFDFSRRDNTIIINESPSSKETIKNDKNKLQGLVKSYLQKNMLDPNFESTRSQSNVNFALVNQVMNMVNQEVLKKIKKRINAKKPCNKNLMHCKKIILGKYVI